MAVSDRIAVMNEGGVVQEGSAQDLYDRPASTFVAQFVGRVNLVPARVVAVEPDAVAVEALGAVLRGRPPAARVSPGEAVSLLLRPETLELDRDAAAGPLKGTVASHAYLGEKIEYLVRCGEATLQVVRYNAGPGEVVANGTAVSLRPARGAAAVLSGTPR